MAYVYKGTDHDTAPVPEDLVRDPSTPGPKPRKFDPSKCGSRAGFKQHARHDQDPCTPCEEANRAYQDAYNASRRRVRQPRVLQPCGTYPAYARHRRNGEKPCAPCTAANTAYQGRQSKDRDGRTKLTLAPLDPSKCGTYRGYSAHKRRGQDPCGPCAAARTKYYQDWEAQQERSAA